MHYSPSQLDAGDVDPVAEADVYLAYGRDLQAEEILKEALRTDPNRTALHQKLADIYAKRHDRKAFEAVAQTLHGLTQGKGVDWQRLADQGRILDPENALYQPAGSAPLSAAAVAGGATVAAAGLAAASLATSRPLDMDVHREGPATLPMDLDMDLNMDLPGGLADASLPAQHASPLPAPAPMPSEQDFAALEPTLRAPLEATPSAKDDTPRIEPRVEPPVASLDMPGFQPTAHASLTDALNHSNAMDDMRPTEMLSLDMPGSQATDSFPATEPSPLTSSTTDDSHAKTELLSLDAMEFNLEGLSTATPAPTPATPQAGGVLETAAEAKPEPAE